MQEQKMAERKKETGIGKESKGLSEEKEAPASKNARKETEFMEEERQGSKTADRGKAPHEVAKDVTHGRSETKDTGKLQEEGKNVSGRSHTGSKEDIGTEGKSSESSKSSEKAGTRHR